MTGDNPSPSWSARYGERHRLERITTFPPGIQGAAKVRLYQRQQHFVLQWWDPAAKRTLSDRVDGDLVAAIMRARQIDERLAHLKSAGGGRRRITHAALVERFGAHLEHRAAAREIDPRTVVRYRSALAYYQAFTEQPVIGRAYPTAGRIDQDFALQLAAYLTQRQISPNGHPHTPRRPLVSTGYIEDICRTMFAWAADPLRGNLLPDGFCNPFAGRRRRLHETARDLFGEPDITLAMARDFLGACDRFQLPIFSLLVFYGLRAAEPCLLFHENIADGWLRIPCLPALAYVTKGRRDKRVPLIAPLPTLLPEDGRKPAQGLLFVRRGVVDGREQPRLKGASLPELEAEFAARSQRAAGNAALDQRRLRELLLRDAGAIGYDHLEHEFHRVARTLNWPAQATVKDFRHLFASTMENAGMPEFYRRYLLGQSPGKSAIVHYTHLNELRTQYEEAVRRRFQPLVETVTQRLAELNRA